MSVIKTFTAKITYVLLGVICCSSFNTVLCLDILHLPLAVPELLFIPFFFVLKKDINKLSWDRNRFVLLFMILALLVLLAIIWAEYPVSSIMSTARNYVWLIVFFCIFKKNKEISYAPLLYIAIGSLLGWLIAIRFEVQAQGLEYMQTYGAMLAVTFCYGMSLKEKSKVFLLIGLLLIVLVCLFSGLRRVIVVAVATIALFSLIRSMESAKRLVYSSILIVTLVGAMVLSFDFISDTLYEISPYLHHRVILKTENMFNGQGEDSDETRSKHIKELFENIEENMLPHGIVSKKTTTDKNVGIFMDLPMKEMIYTLGFPLAFIFFLALIMRCGILLKKYLKQKDSTYDVIFVGSVVMLILLFLEGSFLSFTYAVPYTGFCLGRLYCFTSLTGRRHVSANNKIAYR